MKKIFTIFFFILLVAFPQTKNFGEKLHNEFYNPVQAVKGVLERLIPQHENDFIIKYNPDEKGNDEFEIEAKDGIVNVTGNSAIAITKGIYYYLRHAANCQVTWSGSNIYLPSKLPDFPDTKIVSPYKYRLYYNVCAFGYSTAFWDWNQWEKEIDWMALHGINMPLAMIGKEAVWKKVWKKLGITNKELDNYFTGPAFLPWHQMGNINKHGGPLPESYFIKSEALQKKILNRMRELGMHPVVPAFSGYVPEAIKRIYPDADIISMKPWSGFSPKDGTYMLSPLSKHFAEIGKDFIKEYQKEYGQTHFYLADAFNEMTVPVNKENRYSQLTNFGKAIYNSILAGDSNGVWVMQGWLFYNDKKFWDKPSVEAFLKDVPDNRMIIIDLANELFHGWKKLDGFFGKEWIFSIIHNFGGRNELYGNIPRYSNDAIDMLENPHHGNLIGFGISPEGIENNDIVYEFLTDLEWTNNKVDLNNWIKNYCLSRYGKISGNMEEAWEYLIKSVYSDSNRISINFYQQRPGLNDRVKLLPHVDFDKAAKLFLSCSGGFEKNNLYRDDAIQIAAQYAGYKVDSLLCLAIRFHQTKKYKSRDEAFSKAFILMNNIDSLLGEHPLYRLARWIKFARSWGINTKEKNFYEENAKRQITTWGGSHLSEYAAKVWNGLIKDYYLKRWERFADSLKYGTKYSILNWEEKWITNPTIHFDKSNITDPVLYSQNLILKARKFLRDVEFYREKD